MPYFLALDSGQGVRETFAWRRTALTMKKCLVVLALACSQIQVSQAKEPVQAAPLITVLESVRVQNAGAFEHAFSSKIRQAEKAKGSNWTELMKEGQKKMTSHFGNYHLDQFGYTFQGTSRDGNLTCFFEGRKAFTMRVINEKSQWKLNEH